ncbi:MAG: DNA repair exonuclease [Nanoarchaeota archaeon]|nr:DNA repair exonuclease [Nanoarchaeota archaeon]MBU1501564.1 DNA repair exonuclease [Nanoarchaeota archaeon]MBU2459094.1 DNA repair exonuclease [Nanoarchaeota archaeon]
MVRFAHLADVHLGGWKQLPLQNLNLESFRKAVDICIKEKVEFVIIAGDIFDSAFPSIDILKESFAEFRRLKEAGIPCFIIAGSHDYSVSGKTFLDVLEKSGFCKNVLDFEEKDEKIILNPTIHRGVAIYGYPGKTSGLEIKDLRRIELNDAPGMFKIFMLHTTIDKAKGDLPIDSLETAKVPPADYYAMGHLHMDFRYENFVYPGPIFPNNFQELEDLEHGRFCIVDTSSGTEDPIKKITLPIKGVVSLNVEVKNALLATEKIIAELEKRDIEDKIVLLRVRGVLESGKTSDIKFSQIEEAIKRKNAYFLLRNTHELKVKEEEIEIEVGETENIEEETIKFFSEQNNSNFNKHIPQLMNTFVAEKQEGETTENFTNRLLDDAKKILNF